MKYPDFAKRFRTACEQSGTTNQKALGHALGVSQPAINHYLNGDKMPSTANAVRFCRALNVNLEWLMLGSGPMKKGQELTEDEQHLLHDYRDNDEDGQAGIRNHARMGRLAQERKDTPGQGLTDKVA